MIYEIYFVFKFILTLFVELSFGNFSLFTTFNQFMSFKFFVDNFSMKFKLFYMLKFSSNNLKMNFVKYELVYVGC
jgi:hypothetical protein